MLILSVCETYTKVSFSDPFHVDPVFGDVLIDDCLRTVDHGDVESVRLAEEFAISTSSEWAALVELEMMLVEGVDLNEHIVGCCGC